MPATSTISILKAIRDENIFRPFLANADGKLRSWHNWMVYLRCLFGLPIENKEDRLLVKTCTGRSASSMPEDGFDTSLVITGRRCGKTRIGATIGAYLAALGGYEERLAAGEQGLVLIASPTKKQSGNLRRYLGACFDAPLLANEVINEPRREGFDLATGISVEIMAGDWRTVRGYTLIAAILDELAFFGIEENQAAKSDTELVNAVRPALTTVGGKLIGLTTPYAKRGYVYKTWDKHWGNPFSPVLVWHAPSKLMNPNLKQAIIDEALAEDYARARSEFYADWRDDVGLFIDRALVERLVIKDRGELQPQAGVRYFAFVDFSGGRSDSAALAIGHRENRNVVVVDFLREYRAPFNPVEVVLSMITHLNKFYCRRVIGDNYAGEWVAGAFGSRGISYGKCPKPKRELYLEMLPKITSQQIELPDNQTLINQLSALERRSGTYGNDIVDHPQRSGSHDDVANAVAGLSFCLSTHRKSAGAL